MKLHEVKIRPEYFEAVMEGKKTFEIRIDDRDYRVGDAIDLKEWNGITFTGRSVIVDITYILKDYYPAIEEGYVVMSIVPHKT